MASGAVLRRLSGALVLGLAEAAVVLGLTVVLLAPASAQHRGSDDRFPFLEDRSRRGGPSGGGGGWGGGWGGGGFFGFPNEQRPAAPVVENNSKAPPPAKKADTCAPLTSVVVLGDSMADWL